MKIVAHSEDINMTSLALVSGELVAEIEEAASRLEQFVDSPDDAESLQGCIQHIETISGTLSLIQLVGADILAREILELAREMVPGELTPLLESQLEILSDSFFILPRYLEYVQQTRRGMPVLLIDAINRLRKSRGVPQLPECHFFQIDIASIYIPPAPALNLAGAELSDLLRRLRHMYQLGLLNVLRDHQTKAAMGMMQRAAERLQILAAGRPMAALWYLVAAGFESLKNQDIRLSASRKQVLTVIDRQIKLLQAEGLTAFDREPSQALLKMMIFWSALSDLPTDRSLQVQSVYPYAPLTYTALELEGEAEALRGPNASTLASVAAVLFDELNKTKDMLETIAIASSTQPEDFEPLQQALAKIADILAVVGLVMPGNALRNEVDKITDWVATGIAVEREQLLEIADILLYVESTIAGLDQLQLSDEKLLQANSVARQEVIANSQLAAAQLLVIKEADTALGMVKRALSAFAETSFDVGHIRNVSASLDTIRGAMAILQYPRATRILVQCGRFIEGALMQNTQPAALYHLLETFADAIISLEYYIDALRSNRKADDTVLQVAEESLAALGYPV